MDTNVIIAIAAPVSAIVIWALRLEGRINLQERLNQVNEGRYADLKADVSYIRQRIDQALSNSHER